MQVRILGPVEVEHGSHVTALDVPKQRAVLTALALRVGNVVSIDELATALWGEDPPATAIGTIRSHVSRLRRVVGDEMILTEEAGYVLALPEESVDARRFEALVRAGSAALDDRDPSTAAAMTARALDLWRGVPLTDLADGDFRSGQTTRLEELHLLAAELWAEAELALGHHEMLVGDLERSIAEQPLRETRWARLMLALYRCGRQADALRAYRRLRATLADELGIEPSAELERLESRILHRSAQLDLDPPPPPGNLPSPVSSFVGRDDEVREVAKLAGEHRLMTLLGPAGVGKTRLAIEAAGELRASCRDGVWWVDLAMARGPEDLPSRVATELGVTAAPGSTPEGALAGFVRHREMLLVLDNCEHLAEATALTARRLLEVAPALRVVATSRIPLGLDGEYRVAIGPMELPPRHVQRSELADFDAVRLFVERLVERSVAAPSDGELDLVGEICHTLDGLPLAIELAAARVGELGLPAVRENLDHRLDILASAPGVKDVHHRSLRAALDWSYDMLDEPSRDLFDRLAVLPGDFDLAAAEGIAEAPLTHRGEIRVLLAKLVEASMVVSTPAMGGEPRFRLLATMRAYGREHLQALGVEGEVLRCFSDHYRGVARTLGREIGGLAPSGSVIRVLDAEGHNLRAAVAWSLENDPRATTLEFANAVGELLVLPGAMTDARELLEAMLEESDDSPRELVGWALFRLVLPTFFTGDMAPAIDLADRARALLAAAGQPAGVVATMSVRGWMIAIGRGEIEEALPWFEQALDASDRPGLELERALALGDLAQTLALADRATETVHGMTVPEMLAVAEATFRDGDFQNGLAHVAMCRWLHAAALDDRLTVERAAHTCLTLSRAAGSRGYEQMGLLGLGMAHLLGSELDDAEVRFLQGARLALDDGNLLQLAPALQGLAGVAGARGAAVHAARIWGTATQLFPPLPLLQRTIYERFVAPAGSALGEDLSIEIAAGRHLTPERALDLVLTDQR